MLNESFTVSDSLELKKDGGIEESTPLIKPITSSPIVPREAETDPSVQLNQRLSTLFPSINSKVESNYDTIPGLKLTEDELKELKKFLTTVTIDAEHITHLELINCRRSKLDNRAIIEFRYGDITGKISLGEFPEIILANRNNKPLITTDTDIRTK